MKTTEEQFEELAQQTSEKATRIECEPEEYIDGLKTVIDQMEMDIEAAKETL
jgi:hypothetical protein